MRKYFSTLFHHTTGLYWSILGQSLVCTGLALDSYWSVLECSWSLLGWYMIVTGVLLVCTGVLLVFTGLLLVFTGLVLDGDWTVKTLEIITVNHNLFLTASNFRYVNNKMVKLIQKFIKIIFINCFP